MMRLLLLFLVVTPGLTVDAAEVVDDRGQLVRIERPAHRIASLAPNVTELLFAAGAGEGVVATLAHSDYPEAARRIPRIGDFSGIDLERLLALQPDLVVGWGSGNPPATLARIEALGIPLYVSEIRELDAIARTLVNLGTLAGSADTARQAAEAFDSALSELRRDFQEGRPIRVFYQVSARPLYTVNGEHLISEVLDICGAENIFAQLELLAPPVSIEAVLVADPEVIVTNAAGTDEQEVLSFWKRWPGIQAVAQGNIVFVDADLLHRPTPRIIAGARSLCESLDRIRERSPRPRGLIP